MVEQAFHGVKPAQSSSDSTSSVETSTTRSCLPIERTPSSSITVQNGQATASVSAPVSAASRTRSSLIGRAALLHPHVRAAGAAAERPLAVARHLDRLADRGDELARLVAHVVVAREVAGVVVGDLALSRLRLEPAVAHELREKLRVVHHLVATAEVRVLVAERVEAVRAARDDLRHPRVVQRRDVLLRVGLEDVLVAHAPRRIAGARLARAEDREVDARLLQQLHRRLGRVARTLVVRGGAADPVEDLRRRLALLETRTPSPSAHDARSPCGLPHGLPTRSTSRSIDSASCGKLDCIITRSRRRSTMWSMCSIDTGHSCTHAPQVTQSQIISSGTPLPAIGDSSPPASSSGLRRTPGRGCP